MKKILLLVLLIGLVVLTACGGGDNAANTNTGNTTGANNSSGDTGSDTVGDEAPIYSATLNNLEGDVSAKQAGAAEFSAATEGLELDVAGQVSTADESRVKMDFRDGTVVRIGPNSLFTLEAIDDGDDGLIKKLIMEAGKLWIALNGGSMDVDAPSGVASVRGSYLSIDYDPDTGTYYVTCLEGDCSYTDSNGDTVDFKAGETVKVEGVDGPPEKDVMDDQDFQDWMNNSEEAEAFLLGECEDLNGDGVIDFDEYYLCAQENWNDDLPANGSISDFVWNDANGNGLQDEGEKGVSDVEAVLYSGEGEFINTAMTDGSGFYAFEGVEPGEYYLEFIPPGEYLFTLKDEGDDDNIDNDADENGMTDPFVLGSGEELTNMDAGLVMAQAGGGATCPLTGLPVDNPEDLNLRPIAVSISHFPPEATRPPTGINWAPFVYEFFIGAGQTRLFSLFYCGYPEITFGQGDGAATPSENNYPAVGNWVWGDVDADGIQDEGEPGVPEILVKLFKSNGDFVAETYTDDYGYYFFDNVVPGEYYVTFNPGKTGYEFTYYQEGDDPTKDSDAFSNGVTHNFEVTEGFVDDIDAGMVIVVRIQGVRSGRVLYVDIAKYFNAGLVYKGADPEVEKIVGGIKCASASSSDSEDIGAGGIDVTRLQNVAAECATAIGNTELDVYEFGPMPIDGEPAPEFMMFYNYVNRTWWKYDPALGGYVRYQNSIDEPEEFTMSTDRLSREPVVRSNVIVLFTKHTVQNPEGTIIDISLDYQEGYAKLFRDGMMYDICWDTRGSTYKTESNRFRPILFTDCNENILPLAMGSTWVNLVDQTAGFWYDEAHGYWYARFYAPEYGK